MNNDIIFFKEVIFLDLNKKVAFVTGASIGLGKGLIEELSKNGCNVIIGYNKSKEKAEWLKKNIEEKYNVKVEMDITKEPIPPIINDKYLVDTTLECGSKIWNKNCRLVDKHFLSGDSAAYYFDYAKGVFIVFTAEIEKETNYPIHNGKFNMNESRYYDVVKTLYSLIEKIK